MPDDTRSNYYQVVTLALARRTRMVISVYCALIRVQLPLARSDRFGMLGYPSHLHQEAFFRRRSCRDASLVGSSDT